LPFRSSLVSPLPLDGPGTFGSEISRQSKPDQEEMAMGNLAIDLPNIPACGREGCKGLPSRAMVRGDRGSVLLPEDRFFR
jgi:hypothetical protein